MNERLPIYDIEKEIVAALGTTRRLILQSPTASGKSTQVPQMLRNHGLLEGGRAVILQPRRLAARLLASRVAEELGVELGREVGYQVRFENVTSAATQIKFETEGILLRQMIQDPSLAGIRALIFDEFHERHLYGDITLARALEIQETSRPDLLLIVMSATLDAGALEKYLKPCVVLASAGRTYPVSVDYLPKRVGTTGPPIWELAADAFSASARDGGDVLIFMPGGYEIQRTLEALRQRPQAKGYLLLPLYGELAPKDQDAAVMRYGQPKVVVATNVAETSITIDGVRLVIDGGLARIPRYDPNRGINTLLVERSSQASAEQRAGRAGRTAPGRCIRLWSRAEHDERQIRDLPEIRRLDLSEVVLTLKASGVEDLRKFRWLEAAQRCCAESRGSSAAGPWSSGTNVESAHGHYGSGPPHAGFPGASAIRAHAPCGAGFRLRLPGLSRRRAHTGPGSSDSQRRQGSDERAGGSLRSGGPRHDVRFPRFSCEHGNTQQERLSDGSHAKRGHPRCHGSSGGSALRTVSQNRKTGRP